MAKECWKKKEKKTQKCFKYDKEEHIVKDCKGKQSMKTTKKKTRNKVLKKILSRHGTRDLTCKFSK